MGPASSNPYAKPSPGGQLYENQGPSQGYDSDNGYRANQPPMNGMVSFSGEPSLLVFKALQIHTSLFLFSRQRQKGMLSKLPRLFPCLKMHLFRLSYKTFIQDYQKCLVFFNHIHLNIEHGIHGIVIKTF